MDNIEIRRELHGTDGYSVWLSESRDRNGVCVEGWRCIRSTSSGNMDHWLRDDDVFQALTRPLVTIHAEVF